MALINQEEKQIHCKVVYFGPSLGGKTTNMQWIHAQVKGQDRSYMEQINTNPERTMFFDVLPLDIGNIRGMRTRFHIYTVPGQTALDDIRRIVMKGLDGIVFVADSQAERMDENIESMRNLEKNLEKHGYDIREIPMIIQYNKRDLPNAMPIAELRAALNKFNTQDIEAVAASGRGVKETLSAISRRIITSLKGGNA